MTFQDKLADTGSVHGGPDMWGVPAYDLSTNTNACGPHRPTEQAVREADARHYPDPAYTALTIQLAAWHGVAPARIVLGASGSELIQRLSAAVAFQALPGRQEASAWWPMHAYGDYARAARAAVLRRTEHATQASLIWACDPSSPMGQPHDGLAEQAAALRDDQTLVLDQAYEPLRLSGALALEAEALDRVWRLITPNKALGLTGVRAAYLVAPRNEPELLPHMRALAPSWPLGVHGVALLQSWATVDTHQWLAQCRTTLRTWKARQLDLLSAAGWRTETGVANFFTAACEDIDMKSSLDALRQKGFKLRDCASFGLPGSVRMAVVMPAVQDMLMQALREETRA
ncbi:aminotransferase class I/II-fold pyridoxal phosphate-dependent enzyme [Ottowia sp. VDI28]|uniref:aminotransferase class I/II-fold pyridoxal phosphate-dependent enzyme n=1 Tax=Ottowia sp. VDI28 TaxID=3133968 RepID=UPI003C2F6A30